MKLRPEFIRLTKETRLHNCPIPIIGLTGGIATGKSTVSKILKEKGLAIISADDLIHLIYCQQETKDFIASEFPGAIEGNAIDFKILRKIAFEKDENREKLESFLYQRLPAAFTAAIPEGAEEIVYDVPLLFEKGLDKLVDVTVCVYAPRKTQIERLSARDSTDTELAEKILAKQMDIEEKKVRAQFVLNNTADRSALRIEVQSFLDRYFY